MTFVFITLGVRTPWIAYCIVRYISILFILVQIFAIFNHLLPWTPLQPSSPIHHTIQENRNNNNNKFQKKKKILNRKRRIKGDFRSLIWKIIQEGRYRMRMLSDTIGGSIDLARLCTAQYICTAINFTNFPSGKETIESIESPLESQDRLWSQSDHNYTHHKWRSILLP